MRWRAPACLIAPSHAEAAAIVTDVLLPCFPWLQVYLASQCHLGPLHPELYKAGAMALEMGMDGGPQMTPECAVVKMMLCLKHPDIPLGVPLAGEL